MTTYTIKQVSQMFGLPASTLRYYEEIGLLPAVEKTKANQRIYTEEHIGEILALLKEQDRHVAEQIEKLQSARKQINRKLRYYSDIKASMDSGSTYPFWGDY